MDRQESDLSLQRMAVESRLLLCALHADDDVTQHLAAVVLVHVIDAVLTQREAQHIRGIGLLRYWLFSSAMAALSTKVTLISAGSSKCSYSSTALQARRMRMRRPEGTLIASASW